MNTPYSNEGHWHAAGRSLAGGSHQRRGEGGDDRHLLLPGEKVSYLAIADGAGSAARSSAGAQMAVFTAIDWLRDNSLLPHEPRPELQLRRCFTVVHHRIHRMARAQQSPPEDFACTLLVAAVCGRAVLGGHVGDGALVASVSAQLATLLQDRSPGPANRSAFVTDDDFAEQLRVEQRRGVVDAVVAVTDGVENLTITRGGELRVKFYQSLIDKVRSSPSEEARNWIAGLLDSPMVRSHCDDDMTIAVLAKEGADGDVPRNAG